MAEAMKQGGTADSVNIRPWQRIRFSARDFRVYYEPLRREVPRLAGKLSHRKENNHEDQPIYGGAIGYISLTGNLDLCIVIRIAYKKRGEVFVRSGAGIVADSDPGKEYQESLNKARAVILSLEIAQKEVL